MYQERTDSAAGREARAAIWGPPGGDGTPECLPWWQQQYQPQSRARRQVQRQHQGRYHRPNQFLQNSYNAQNPYGFQSPYSSWTFFDSAFQAQCTPPTQGSTSVRRQQQQHSQPIPTPRRKPLSYQQGQLAPKMQEDMFPTDLTGPKPPPIMKGVESTSEPAKGMRLEQKRPKRTLPQRVKASKAAGNLRHGNSGKKGAKAKQGKRSVPKQAVGETSEEESEAGPGEESEEAVEEVSEDEEVRGSPPWKTHAKAKARAKAVPIKTKKAKPKAALRNEEHDSECSACTSTGAH